MTSGSAGQRDASAGAGVTRGRYPPIAHAAGNGAAVIVTPSLDRLLNHSHALNIRGDSHRLRENGGPAWSGRARSSGAGGSGSLT